MSQTLTILDFYKKVLHALNFQIEDGDLISFVGPDGGVRPTTVDGRRLVLPTEKLMRDGFGDDFQPFHPICENIARKGASPVLATLQRTAKAMVAYYINELAEQLLTVAADSSLHKDLPPECSEYLKKVPQADKKTLSAFKELMKRAIAKNQLITFYLKNGGKYQGDKVNRMCVVRFPIMVLLETEEDSVLGVKLRKKDKKTISALLHYVVPFGEDPEEYSAGSDSRVAPFFDAFLKAYAKIAKQINKLVHRYAKPLNLDMKSINLGYEKGLEDLGQFYDKLPSLRGNEGALAKGESEAPTPAPTAAPQPTQPAPTQPAPAPQGAPAPQPQPQHSNTMTVDEFLGRGQPQTPPPQYNQPVQGYGQANYGGQPIGGYGQPQQMGYGNYNMPPQQASFGMGYGQPQPEPNPYTQAVQMFGHGRSQQQPPAQPTYGQPLPWENAGGGQGVL